MECAELQDSFRFRRYTDVPFPRYRFVPGKNPHPTAHPEGHSYRPPGRSEHSVTPVEPQAWATSIDYLHGADLYNHAYWWEAHEAWEGLWQLTDKRGVQGRFLQGLIQVAACHLKLWVRHLAGVERLRTTAVEHLTAVLSEEGPACYMGLDVATFVDCVRRYYARGGRAKSPAHDPVSYPYLELGV